LFAEVLAEEDPAFDVVDGVDQRGAAVRGDGADRGDGALGLAAGDLVGEVGPVLDAVLVEQDGAGLVQVLGLEGAAGGVGVLELLVVQGAAELEPFGVLGALAVVDQLVLLLIPDPALAAGQAEPGGGEPVGAEEGPLAGGVVGPGARDLQQLLDAGRHGEAGVLHQVGAAVDGVGRAAVDAAGDAEDPRGLGVLGVGGPHGLAPGGGLAAGQQRPAVGD